MLRMATTKCKTEALATQVVGCILCMSKVHLTYMFVLQIVLSLSVYTCGHMHVYRVFIGREHPGISPIYSQCTVTDNIISTAM